MNHDHHAHPYGVGLAWRSVIADHCLEHRDEVDLLEISTEDYIIRERRLANDPDDSHLQRALAAFPCVAHGLSLSIGSVEPLPESCLAGTRKFLARTGIDTFSEHLAFHRMDGKDLTLFLSMPFEEASAQWIAHNYRAVREAIGRPFALENVTYDFPAARPSFHEVDFIRRVTEETDATLLLDVTNLFNNAENQGYDARDFIDRLPLDRITQFHLAGGYFAKGKWVDSHSHPVMEPVWELFDELVRRAPNADFAILERDSHFEPFDSVLADVRRAREIFYAHRPAQPAPRRHAASTFEMPPLETVARPNPRSPRFSQLRGYQRALMKRITDPAFREAWQADAPVALTRVDPPLTPEWTERLMLTDPAAIARNARNYDAIEKEDREVQEHYEDVEWGAWAMELSQ